VLILFSPINIAAKDFDKTITTYKKEKKKSQNNLSEKNLELAYKQGRDFYRIALSHMIFSSILLLMQK